MAGGSVAELTRAAAIDIGSNGIRMVVAEMGDGAIREIESVRAAVRLGEDAFTLKQISPATCDAVVQAFERFRRVLDRHDVQRVRAVATSAMRDSSNGRQLVARIKQATGIDVRIISGIEEAQVVYAGVAATVGLEGCTALLIDMGGGSVEVTVTRDGHPIGCETLPLGAVRLLQRMRDLQIAEGEIDPLIARFRGAVVNLIETELEGQQPELCVGTGGNLECLARLRGPMLGKTKTDKVKLADLDPMLGRLLTMKVSQRIDELQLRPDRADVIAIAAMVLRMILSAAGIKKMLVPGIGLKDGLLRQMFDHAR